MATVAIYSRLSQDRDGTKTSTARQEADCKALAKARGWTVSKVYRDDAISAYNGKARAAFDEMVTALDSGKVAGIVAWKVDRLGRRTAEVAQLLDRVTKQGGFVATCDGLDSSTPMGKGVMQVASVFGEMESANNSARTSRAKLEAARSGLPSGGGLRPFGYKAGGLELNPKEAQRVREAASEILAGGTLRGIAARWNRDDVRTSEGHAWAPATLRRLLMGGRIAAIRYYRGEPLGDAVWPPIITKDEHERLRAILGDPSRRTSKPEARRYLLTGFVRCGRCGEPLVASRRAKDRKRTYTCRSQKRGDDRNGACGGVRMMADDLEQIITEAILYRLDSPAFARMRRTMRNKKDPTAAVMKQLHEDEKSLEELTHDHYVSRRLNRAEFLAAHDVLKVRIAEARGELASDDAATVLVGLPSSDQLRDEWEWAGFDRKRAIIGAVIESITVNPIGRGQRSSEERLDVTWRA